ncbi:hypothetical protein AVEN_29388-1 [Araneus ventricosus]|uniref:Uncharacterized protein n=1 Tax=Araneus ventricosus TaxID=182803 RepID=A0A4Y2UL36_ARAVE|nr:hypothetical protein AVEN_29388-1 [Araneus ventricosus]
MICRFESLIDPNRHVIEDVNFLNRHTYIKKFEAVYNNHLQDGTVTTREQFDYAWCLIRSKYPTDIRRGVVLLEDLFRHGDATAKRDYMYYLAIGHTKLKVSSVYGISSINCSKQQKNS